MYPRYKIDFQEKIVSGYEGILEKKNFDAEHGFAVVVVCRVTTHIDPTLQERFSREDSLLISNGWSVV